MEWEALLNHNSSLLSSNYRLNLHNSLNSPELYRSDNQHLTHLLKGHDGCVNCLQWSHDGRWLLSGSDDRTLIINKYTPGGLEAPEKAFSLQNRFKSGHFKNIYDAKFDPINETRIVSAGADGFVCVVDDWTIQSAHRESSVSRTLRADSKGFGTKSLEFIDANNVLIACEDGHLIQFDLRQKKPARKVLLDMSSMRSSSSPYSMSQCPSAPHMLALSAAEPLVRIFDLRASMAEPTHTWTPPLKLGKRINVATAVKFSRFGYSLAVNCLSDGPYLIDPVNQTDRQIAPLLEEAEVIKCPGLQREISRWKYIQGLYKENKFSQAAKELAGLILQHRSLTNNSDWYDILIREVFNRALCLGQLPENQIKNESISDDLSLAAYTLDYWPARYLLIIYMVTHFKAKSALVQCKVFLALKPERKDDIVWRLKIEEIKNILSYCELDSSTQIPKLIPANFAKICSEMPPMDLINCKATQNLQVAAKGAFNGYLAHCKGILHKVGMKEVAFVGDSDQYIGVGSDNGFAFIFPCPGAFTNENIKFPVWAAKADLKGGVTTVQGHPHLPCIATAGLDSTIKIWQPSFVPQHSDATAASDFEMVKEKDIPQLVKTLPNMEANIPNALMYVYL